MESLRSPSQLDARARWAVGMLASSVVISSLSSLMSLVMLLSDEFEKNTLLFVARAQVFFILLTAAAWLTWQYRAHQRLGELGRVGMKVTPGWAIGWWFVPLANFVKVPATLQELWKASDERAGKDDWVSRPNTNLIGNWFGFYILGGAVSNLSARVESANAYLAMTFISDALFVVAGILAINIVRKIEWRLDHVGVRPWEVDSGFTAVQQLRSS